ncbi:MAG: hypothetical protein U0528_09280 [Anaerolineae bacterium]
MSTNDTLLALSSGRSGTVINEKEQLSAVRRLAHRRLREFQRGRLPTAKYRAPSPSRRTLPLAPTPA